MQYSAMVDMQGFKNLYEFCLNMRKLYIYGADEKSQSIYKALNQSVIKVSGYIKDEKDLTRFKKPKLFPNIFKTGLIVNAKSQYIQQEALERGFRHIKQQIKRKGAIGNEN